MNHPSIFNDVIGPVMRGPSSSHSAAAVRIGAIARDLMGGRLERVTVRFDLNGSLPTTYLSQGSDMGLSAGFLGFAPDDGRLVAYRAEREAAGLEVIYENGHFGDEHPNTYNLTLQNNEEEHTLTALSIGGGIAEVTRIDGLDVSFFGDAYGLVVFGAEKPALLQGSLERQGCRVVWAGEGPGSVLFASSSRPLEENPGQIRGVEERGLKVRPIAPVLPVLTPDVLDLPFTSCAEMERFAAARGMVDLAELAIAYESRRGGTSGEDVLAMAGRLIEIMENSRREGIEGTAFSDRILPRQSDKYLAARRRGELLGLGAMDDIVVNVTALMEVKSAMGVIVAAPTAGSCGGLPGAMLAVGDKLGLEREERARGLLAAGLIGVLVATKSTFSAEVCGCQAECGVSSGMTAGAVATLLGGEYKTAMAAASMALQNIFGMVCDPVANRVEVPCLGKNILAAANGVSCANMALAGFDQVVPFDQVVEAMDKVGRALPHELRCTALGGLSLTPASQEIAARLASS